jgi:hypothetical protein
MAAANLGGHLEYEEFSLLFKSSREFFFAPVIEYGPLAEWKDLAGGGQEMQDVFWYIKEAIDAYFDGRPFQVTVKAGCLIGRKHEPREVPPARPERDDALPRRPHPLAAGSVQMVDPDELEIEEVEDFEVELDEHDEHELDAFIEGKKRPPHLDD